MNHMSRYTLAECLVFALLAALAILTVTSAGRAADWVDQHVNPTTDFYDPQRAQP